MLEDGAAPTLARIAAAPTLSPSERLRVRVAAAATVTPKVRVALETAADEHVDANARHAAVVRAVE